MHHVILLIRFTAQCHLKGQAQAMRIRRPLASLAVNPSLLWRCLGLSVRPRSHPSFGTRRNDEPQSSLPHYRNTSSVISPLPLTRQRALHIACRQRTNHPPWKPVKLEDKIRKRRERLQGLLENLAVAPGDFAHSVGTPTYRCKKWRACPPRCPHAAKSLCRPGCELPCITWSQKDVCTTQPEDTHGSVVVPRWLTPAAKPATLQLP